MKRLGKIRFAPVAAAVFALVTGILIFSTPTWLFERAIVASGLPALLPAAKPPLGDTARILVALATAALVGLSIWLPLSLISKAAKAKRPKARGTRIEPVIRGRDEGQAPAHRRPIFAESDLGAPFMSDEAMAIAKDELVLDAPMLDDIAPIAPSIMSRASVFETPEEIASAPEFAGFETVDAPLEVQVEAPVYAAPVTPEPVLAVEKPAAPAAPQEDVTSIASLMQRLDDAVVRRQSRGETSALPGTIGGLREAMGLARPRKSAAG